MSDYLHGSDVVLIANFLEGHASARLLARDLYFIDGVIESAIQAQLAARDAEIGRLRAALQAIVKRGREWQYGHPLTDIAIAALAPVAENSARKEGT